MSSDLFSKRPPGDGRLTHLEGVIERITFVSEESGWTVIRLQAGGKGVTAVGNMLGVQPGESLRLSGRWAHDRKYGEQFRVESYLAVQPATLVGLEKYLGSGLVRGMGKVMASRLVKRFELETLDVIEHQPWRLTHVHGIGPKRKERILAAWEEHKAVKEVMVFLQSSGVSPAYAVKICKRYGNKAVARVKENPFRLAEEIFGIGFKTADAIAANLGIALDSPARARAGLLHTLGQLSDEGHLCSPREPLVERAAALLGVAPSIVEPALEALVTDRAVVAEVLEGEQTIYLAALHRAEVGAAARLRAILEAEAAPLELDVDAALTALEQRLSITLAGQQRQAVRQAARAKVLVITGGPGTGKTTLVNGVLELFRRQERRILLCAPTGRAAKRMSETSGEEAKTIHRLLEFDPRSRRFQRDEAAPLEADLLVVDEVSMVDAVLLYHLLEAVPDSCQLILVGDVDQLPSVGAGCVLGDLIRSGVIETVTLTEIFRQAQQSLIVLNAHRVNRGEQPEQPDLSGQPPEDVDFFFIERAEPEAVLATIKELVQRRIPRRFGADPLTEIQVLTPMHKGVIGARNLNVELQTLLNPSGASITRGSRIYRVGDKVMQIRNNYDLDVFNGDLGQITRIDEEERELVVRVEGREVSYDTADLDELVHGYACTVHKSQGSEYPVVVLPLHTQHFPMLQRNLLYTGLTRAQRLAVIVGSRKALAIAIRNATVRARNSHLAWRLADAAQIVLNPDGAEVTP
jgi:exodeoxyribonuclease V alpha subunit